MRFLVIATLLSILAVPAFAADVDGKWNGTVTTPQGEIPVRSISKPMAPC